MNKEAYKDGYMHKEALLNMDVGIGDILKEILRRGTTTLLVAPAAIGIAGGVAAHTMGRATDEDLAADQKAIVRSELDEQIANIKRRRALALKEKENGNERDDGRYAPTGGREIHI